MQNLSGTWLRVLCDGGWLHRVAGFGRVVADQAEEMTTDVQLCGARLYFIPLRTRVPLKFGPETVTLVTCARVAVTVSDGQGRRAEGWGETPLSVQWVWPGKLPYETRLQAMKEFCVVLAGAWAQGHERGHPMEI